MREPELVESVRESVKPVTSLLTGIGIPVAAIGGCAVAGALLAAALGSAEPASLRDGARFGALLGFFASFYGIAELLIAFFFSSGRGADLLCRAAGYLAVWITAAGFILGLL